MDDAPQVAPAMINLEREPLRGEVEVDETWIGGTQAGLRGSRQLKGRKAALVLVVVEKRGRVTGRTYHGVSRDQLQVYLNEFVFRHNRRKHRWPRSRPCSVSEPGAS